MKFILYENMRFYDKETSRKSILLNI